MLSCVFETEGAVASMFTTGTCNQYKMDREPAKGCQNDTYVDTLRYFKEQMSQLLICIFVFSQLAAASFLRKEKNYAREFQGIFRLVRQLRQLCTASFKIIPKYSKIPSPL